MSRYQASSPDAQILGQMCLAFLAAITLDEFSPILKKYGFEQIEPDRWYPQQNVLNIFREIADDANGSQNLVAVGVKAADYAVLPPELNTVEKGLLALQMSYQMNHANIPQDEGYAVEITGPGSAYIKTDLPYPDDLMYGTIWGFVRKIKAPTDNFKVELMQNGRAKDSDAPAEYMVKWGQNI
jgi:hypothetical protein